MGQLPILTEIGPASGLVPLVLGSLPLNAQLTTAIKKSNLNLDLIEYEPESTFYQGFIQTDILRSETLG